MPTTMAAAFEAFWEKYYNKKPICTDAEVKALSELAFYKGAEAYAEQMGQQMQDIAKRGENE